MLAQPDIRATGWLENNKCAESYIHPPPLDVLGTLNNAYSIQQSSGGRTMHHCGTSPWPGLHKWFGAKLLSVVSSRCKERFSLLKQAGKVVRETFLSRQNHPHCQDTCQVQTFSVDQQYKARGRCPMQIYLKHFRSDFCYNRWFLVMYLPNIISHIIQSNVNLSTK